MRSLHPVGGELLRRAQGLVDSGHHEVGEQVRVIGIDRARVDPHRLHLEAAAHRDRHHSTAGGRLDLGERDLLLCARHVGLHLLHLTHHLLHVRLGHQGVSSLFIVVVA